MTSQSSQSPGYGKPWLSSSAGMLLVVWIFSGMVLTGCGVDLPFVKEKAEPQVYYVGVDSLTLHEEPGSSGRVLAHLKQYQKVYRDNVENGFARVKVDGTGMTGWVINSKLIWRLPEAVTDEVDDPPPHAPAPPVDDANESPPAVPTRPVDEADDATPKNDEGSIAEPPETGSQSVDPSRFDPF